MLAQAASFVVVLVIGGVTGHSPAPAPAPAHASTSATGGTTSQPEPTIKVTVEGAEGTAASIPGLPGIPVEVLRTDKTVVASGSLSPPQLEWAQQVPPGTYQVCVQQSSGLRFTGTNTHALPGWFCSLARTAAGEPTPVVFHATTAGAP